MISPAITHVPCSLDHQRRLREARAGAAGRWARPARRARASGRGPSADQVSSLGRRGEDVWSALRA